MEIWRHRSILPLGVPHLTKQVSKFNVLYLYIQFKGKFLFFLNFVQLFAYFKGKYVFSLSFVRMFYKLQDTKIGEYLILKNSMVVPLLWAVHHDPRLWEKPDIFSPERFLHEDGTLFRNDNLIPFQTGKTPQVHHSFTPANIYQNT